MPPSPGMAPTTVPMIEPRSTVRQCWKVAFTPLIMLVIFTVRMSFGDRAAGDREVDHLGDREQADQRGDEMHAVPQIFDAAGEARGAGDAVIADGRDHQADAAGEEAAQHPPARGSPRR